MNYRDDYAKKLRIPLTARYNHPESEVLSTARDLREMRGYGEEESIEVAKAQLDAKYYLATKGRILTKKHNYRRWIEIALFFLLSYLFGFLGAESACAQTMTFPPGPPLKVSCGAGMTCSKSGITLNIASNGTGGQVYYQTLQQATASLTQRSILNFFSGITCSDNAGATRTDCRLTIPINGTPDLGKIPIGQGDGTAAFADPLVQGLYADGSTSHPNPVSVGGWDGMNLQELSVDSSGRPNVNINGTVPVSGTFWQATQPVSGTFWQATQPVSGPLTDTQLRATPVPVSGTFWQTTQPVSGTFWQTTQPVSIATAPVLVAGSAIIGKVGIDQTTPGTTNAVAATLAAETTKVIGTVNVAAGQTIQAVGAATGGVSSYHVVSAASTNLANIKASAGTLYGWSCFNTNAAARYVKLHNNAGTPTAGSGVVRTISVPGGGGSNIDIATGVAFGTGIGISIVTGIADADTTAVGASDVVCDINYK